MTIPGYLLKYLDYLSRCDSSKFMCHRKLLENIRVPKIENEHDNIMEKAYYVTI